LSPSNICGNRENEEMAADRKTPDSKITKQSRSASSTEIYSFIRFWIPIEKGTSHVNINIGLTLSRPLT
jgi:hypothetical protein